MGQSELCECVTGVVPVGETGEDKDVPPLMRASNNINLARQTSLREFCEVKDEGNTAEEIHDDDPGKEDSDYVTLEASGENDPMERRNSTINCPKREKNESLSFISRLVEFVPENHRKGNNQENSRQIEVSPPIKTPESVIYS